MRTELSPRIKESCKAFAMDPRAAGCLWKDVTTYSRFEPDKVPTSFETVIGKNCRIFITCGHIHHPGSFIMSCFSLGFDNRVLPGVTDHIQAAESAIMLCRNVISGFSNDFKCQDAVLGKETIFPNLNIPSDYEPAKQ